jgi:hypothetical protein
VDELLELLAQAEHLADLDDDALAELLANLRQQAEAVLEVDPTDEQLEQLERVATVVSEIETEQTSRAEDAQARAERAQGLRERIVGETDETDEGDGGDGAGDGGEGEPGDGGEGTETQEPEGIAAAAGTTPPSRPRVTRASARRPASMTPRPRSTRHEPLSLVAAANLGNVQAGSSLSDPTDLARAFISAYDLARGYRGPRVKVPIARIGREDPGELFGEERTLRMGSPEANTAKIAQLQSVESITASGGRCAPSEVRYDMPTIGVEDRPVRDDMMLRVGADRGGIRTFPVPILSDVEGAIDVWTNDNDIDPGSDGPSTKPCLVLTCPDTDETIVDAVTKCLEFGNFRARFFPEQVQAWLDLAAVWHARFAETRLLTAIGSGSTQVTSGQVLGATPDVLATLNRAVAAINSRWRLGRTGVPLRFGAPAWLLELMRTDIARQLPAGTPDERYAVADASIQRWIELTGVNVTWFLDGESGQIFGPQGDGPLVGWPSTVVTYLYPEGSWLFLDGGTLDLGIVRDSTLNATNDYQIFSETFEAAHFHGIESYRLVLDLCPDGTVSGTVEISPCDTGS